MKRSAALTLAYKFNKKNVSWAFHKFGKNLAVVDPTNGKKIYLRKLQTSIPMFQSSGLSHLFPV